MNRLKELRLKNGYKQITLATELGIKQASLSAWETGRTKPDLENLQRLAELYGVTVDYILGRTDNPAPPSLDEQLSGIDFALSGEIHDLTDDEKQDILDYVRFKRSQKKGR